MIDAVLNQTTTLRPCTGLSLGLKACAAAGLARGMWCEPCQLNAAEHAAANAVHLSDETIAKLAGAKEVTLSVESIHGLAGQIDNVASAFPKTVVLSDDSIEALAAAIARHLTAATKRQPARRRKRSSPKAKRR